MSIASLEFSVFKFMLETVAKAESAKNDLRYVNLSTLLMVSMSCICTDPQNLYG